MSNTDNEEHIRLRGVRTHNLKNIDCDLPRNKLVILTGLSGSGKSSLAFDTLYAEGQRRYVESLSAYARQFLSMMGKPEVDTIEGLSPAIAIDQKASSHNPRSTVGTITEIYDYLRLLYARTGVAHCPEHDIPLSAQSVSQMVDQICALPTDSKIMLLAPAVQHRKGEHHQLFEKWRRMGYQRVRINGEIMDLSDDITLNKRQHHNIDIVIDRLKVRAGIKQRLADSIETALTQSDGLLCVAPMDEESDLEELTFSARHSCPKCGYAISRLEPSHFSFNNPRGACQACDGLGVETSIDIEKLIKNPDYSIDQGAIAGWHAQHPYRYAQLSALAAHYEFDLNTPFNQLPADIQHMLLYGSGKTRIAFKLPTIRGRIKSRTQPFEGIVNSMQRRYMESDVQSVRDTLAKYMSTKHCSHCDGDRLNKTARHVFIEGQNIASLTQMTTTRLFNWLDQITLSGSMKTVAEKILREVITRLGFLVDVGLTYLSLNRRAETLSGGEAQRIRLASQIGSGLVGVMYILDEPSIGLHQRDNERLIQTLKRLRDLGNTVVVVEHDEDTMMAADHLVDLGPGAGEAGGEIIAQGEPQDILKHPTSLTGAYLSGRKRIAVPNKRVSRSCKPSITLSGLSCHNIQNMTAEFPLGLLTCVTGVSGSGKSSLVNGTLFPHVLNHLDRKANTDHPGECEEITGLEHIDKVIDINQSPIGRTPRSNPATYTGILTPIRELFANTPEAIARGYKIGRFSFNVSGGRCEHCQGDGLIKVEMHFLADVYVNCDHCHGKRYNRETLEVEYKGKSIHDVLSMTVAEAHEFFNAIPSIKKKCQTLLDVGLSYIRLGQSATTLSGGEAQRIKLARELAKRDTGKTLYILDEPTTGLHFHDVAQLIEVLYALRDRGNTIIVIEHNLDVIKVADWIIDLGPEGGSGGGQIVAQGTPEKVAKKSGSHTGRFLKTILEK